MGIDVFAQEDQVVVDATGHLLLVKERTEDWVAIADTTLTEDVASLTFTTDIDGDPFVCREIHGCILLPETLASYTPFCFGREAWHAYGAIEKDGLSFTCKVVSGMFALYSYYIREGGVHHISRYGPGGLMRTEPEIVQPFDRFSIDFYKNNFPCPAGTQIQIWGLRS